MQENKKACRDAISQEIGVDNWESVNMAIDLVAHTKFEELAKNCLQGKELIDKDEENAHLLGYTSDGATENHQSPSDEPMDTGYSFDGQNIVATNSNTQSTINFTDDDNGLQIPGTYPQASSRELTATEVQTMTLADLRIMRNEIFARHGYIFKDAALSAHFSAQPWYKPMFDNVNHLLTPTERANISLIKQFENN
ncbi:MAG: YARHG domain-containing protein, partial [Flavobacteriales bacterium]